MAGTNDPGTYRFENFELDLQARDLRRDGVSIPLQELPYKILALLVARSGQVVTRQELRDTVWPAGTYVDFEHGLNTAIKKLRKALGDDAGNPRLIETIPRLGYQFIGCTNSNGSRGTAKEPSPAVPVPRLRSVVSSATRIARLSRLVAAVVVLGAASLFFGWKIFVSGRNANASAARVIRSIAILPLENLTGDPNQEYLVDGLTDSLITNVARIHSLAVTSRTSAMTYQGGHKSIKQIARELNVDAVVEGTVSESNGVIRVNAQMVRGDTDTHLWAGQYQGDLNDVLRLQTTVTEAIADAIHAEVQPVPVQESAANLNVSPQAYEAYLRGRYFWAKRRAEDIQTAIGYFQQAIAAAPDFSQAYAGLADCYIMQVLNAWIPQQEGFEEAMAAAQHAVELNDSSAEAHTSLGGLRALYEWNWAEAEHEFRRALELNPSYAPAHHWYAVLALAPVGRLDEAQTEIDRAHELDPLSAIIETDLGFVHYLRRDYAGAIEDYKKTLELDPNFVPAHFRLGELYQQMGRYDEYVREAVLLARQTEIDEQPRSADRMEKAYQEDGYRGYLQVRGEAIALKHEQSNGYVGLFRLSQGDLDSAFHDFFSVASQHDMNLLYLLVDPEFDALRSDPRYDELVRKTGLPLQRERIAFHRPD
jgi:TolB-like protein/DNA-binding winged helix-turn-helix (wHTH) protein